MLSISLVSLFQPQKDGSLPVSRFFRELFESKSIRLVLGINLAVFTILMGYFSTPTVAFTQEEAVLARPQENIVRTETNFKQPASGFISQSYHWYHPAIDIINDLGTPIYPIAKGKVREVDYGYWGYGHKVIIDHQQNTWSLYAHLGEIKVKPGEEVNKDTLIGTLGLTGWTTGPHLHLEIWQDNHSLNPMAVLPEFNPQLAFNK